MYLNQTSHVWLCQRCLYPLPESCYTTLVVTSQRGSIVCAHPVARWSSEDGNPLRFHAPTFPPSPSVRSVPQNIDFTLSKWVDDNTDGKRRRGIVRLTICHGPCTAETGRPERALLGRTFHIFGPIFAAGHTNDVSLLPILKLVPDLKCA